MNGRAALLVRLAMLIGLLVSVIVLKGRCARAVGDFFETMDRPR